MRNVNGGKFCRLATAPTQCPYSWNVLTGANGNLDQYAYCEPQFSGCQMKQEGNNLKKSRWVPGGPVMTSNKRTFIL